MSVPEGSEAPSQLRVLVDADSMPVRIREIIVQQAGRRGYTADFYANSRIPLPKAAGVCGHVVPDADDAMVETAGGDDLAITHDIPLAARLVEKGLTVLNDRGDRFTSENVGERLSRRDFAKELRDTGILPERPRSFGPREVQAFANAFDRELTLRGVRAKVDDADRKG